MSAGFIALRRPARKRLAEGFDPPDWPAFDSRGRGGLRVLLPVGPPH